LKRQWTTAARRRDPRRAQGDGARRAAPSFASFDDAAIGTQRKSGTIDSAVTVP
jgi:hypothetical protein